MAEQPKRPRICLVTGATRGLGKAVALAYARQGARLVLVGAEKDKAELEKVAHLCASIGAPGCDMHACDTANAEHLQYLAEVLLSRQGRVDVLVFIPDQAQAGADNKSAADGSPAIWQRQLEAGVLAAMRLTASLAPGSDASASVSQPAALPARVCAAPGYGATRGLKRCGGCGAVRYCSAECSRAHWQEHKVECRRLQVARAAAAAAAAGGEEPAA